MIKPLKAIFVGVIVNVSIVLISRKIINAMQEKPNDVTASLEKAFKEYVNQRKSL